MNDGKSTKFEWHPLSSDAPEERGTVLRNVELIQQWAGNMRDAIMNHEGPLVALENKETGKLEPIGLAAIDHFKKLTPGSGLRLRQKSTPPKAAEGASLLETSAADEKASDTKFEWHPLSSDAPEERGTVLRNVELVQQWAGNMRDAIMNHEGPLVALENKETGKLEPIGLAAIDHLKKLAPGSSLRLRQKSNPATVAPSLLETSAADEKASDT